MPHESPRKLRHPGSLEASLMRGLCETGFWGCPLYPHLFFPPQTQGNGHFRVHQVPVSPSSSSSCSSSQPLLPHLVVFSDWVSCIPGSPQTCCAADPDRPDNTSHLGLKRLLKKHFHLAQCLNSVSLLICAAKHTPLYLKFLSLRREGKVEGQHPMTHPVPQMQLLNSSHCFSSLAPPPTHPVQRSLALLPKALIILAFLIL